MTILSYDHIQQRHHEDWTTSIKTIKSLQECNSTETFHDKRRSSLVYMKWYNYDQDIWVTFSWIFSKIRRFISDDEILTKRIRYYQHRNRQSASFVFFINYLKNTSREAHSFYLLSLAWGWGKKTISFSVLLIEHEFEILLEPNAFNSNIDTIKWNIDFMTKRKRLDLCQAITSFSFKFSYSSIYWSE